MPRSTVAAEEYNEPEPPPADDCGFALRETDLPPLEITNLEQGEIVPHEIVILEGVAAESDQIELVRPTDTGEETTAALRVSSEAGDRFKAIALLKPGLNHLGLRAEGHASRCFSVEWQPLQTEHFVRFVYDLGSDSDGAGRDCLLEKLVILTRCLSASPSLVKFNSWRPQR